MSSGGHLAHRAMIAGRLDSKIKIHADSSAIKDAPAEALVETSVGECLEGRRESNLKHFLEVVKSRRAMSGARKEGQ